MMAPPISARIAPPDGGIRRGVREPAIFLVVPLFGVLAVWCTYRVGDSLGQPLAGGLAAVFLSVSPTFLYQLMQPMGDIPAASCWLAALIAASRQTQLSAAGAGLLTSVAIAIRPNLAPLAGLIVLPILTPAARRPVAPGCGLRCRTRSRRDRARLDSARSLRFARRFRVRPRSKTALRSRTSCPMSRVIRGGSPRPTRPSSGCRCLRRCGYHCRPQRAARVDGNRPGACRLGSVPALRATSSRKSGSTRASCCRRSRSCCFSPRS